MAAYASVTYTSTSGTTFALTNGNGDPIPYLRQSDIQVTVNGVLKTLTTDYTFNSAGTAIVLNTAVTSATVILSRVTDIGDATVVYTPGSTLTAQDLNNADNQIRYGLQEFSDTYGALTSGTGDLSTLGGFIGSGETWLSDNAHAPTTGAVDTRVDSKIDTALTTDVVAGDSITVTDNSPSSGQITIGVTNASISTAKLVDSSVTTAKIADGNVTTAKILDANVTTAKILDSNVTTAKIADNAVTSAKIADGTIVAADLASDSVTTAKILDSNVTTGKIADLAVTTGKLADSSVTSAKIADGTIVAGDLASDSVTTAKIVDSNVTTGKIADTAVTTGKLADSSVTAVKIADGVITSAKLNAATVVTAAEQAACTPDDVTFFTTSASDGRYVNVTGDTMSGALAMGTNKITGLGTPTANTDAATKLYVDNSVAAGVGDADYGDITVSGIGTIWTIDSGAVTSAKIADGTIVNGDINASAAIAGTKVSPDFGSQTIATTGIVSHALGTAGAPTVTFTGDPNTGIYSPGADQVAISTGGSGRLFVDASGKVGINTSAPGGQLGIAGSGVAELLRLNAQAGFISFYDGVTRTAYLQSDNSNSRLNFGVEDSNDLLIYMGASERLRITSAGLVGIGTSAPSQTLDVNGVVNFKPAAGYNALFQQSSTSLRINYLNDAASANVSAAYRATSFEWQKGDGGPVVNIDSSGRVGIGTTTPTDTSGYGTTLDIRGSSTGNGGVVYLGNSDATVRGQLAVYGDGRMDFGTTTNHPLKFYTFNSERARIESDGNTLIGKTASSITTAGTEIGSGAVWTTRSAATAMRVNRLTDDGTLVEFLQASVAEGTISVSGTTVSYNGAHLSRWSQLPSGAQRTEILRGSVLSNIDEMCEWGEEENEQLNRMKVSDVEGDKNVSGIFQAWDDDDDTYTNDFYCAMTGDFIIRIAEGVTVDRGDLLMSAGDGTAKPQDDDIIRSKTIAKVTSTHVSCTYEDGSYCVPCVLMAC